MVGATTRRRSDATTPTLAGETGAGPVMGQLADRILALHGWVVLAVVFAVPALESSAFVGFVFPGEIAVLLGGVLASEHRAPLAGVLAAAIAGAIIGDSVGYAVGERWGRRILDGSVGRLVKREHIDRAERYLAERGGAAVFFGRFTAALRVLIPGLAGMARLRYRTFLLYNAAGGALWATGFVLLGYAAGTSWRRVEQIAKRASLILLVVLAGAVVLAVAARWAARHPERLRTAADRILARPLVIRLRARYRRQLAFLARRLRPSGALGLSLTLGIVALAGAGWAFGAIVQDVVARDELGLVDGPAARFFTAHREAWLTSTMRAVTILGDPAVLIGVVLLAGLVGLRRTRSLRPFTLLAEAYLGAFVLRGVVAVLSRPPRPPTPSRMPTGIRSPPPTPPWRRPSTACSPRCWQPPARPGAAPFYSGPARLCSSPWSAFPALSSAPSGSPTCSAGWRSGPPGCSGCSPPPAPSANCTQARRPPSSRWPARPGHSHAPTASRQRRPANSHPVVTVDEEQPADHQAGRVAARI